MLDPPTSTAVAHLVVHGAASGADATVDGAAGGRPGDGALSPARARAVREAGDAGGAGGALRLVIPSAAVHDGLSFTRVIAESESSPPIPRLSRTGLASAPPSTRAIVLVRPAVLDPEAPHIDPASARAWLERAAAALGISVDAKDLPWADDPLAGLVTPV